MEYKMVIAVREDLELSKGKIAVQVAHAAVACAMAARDSIPNIFEGWVSEGQRKVVVRCAGLEELRALHVKARSMGLVTSLVSDAGLTEVPPGTVTCLGIGPDSSARIDKITGSLALW
ncbi:MAG: peptidyl-tRNA hydrolase Pth2 [Candidatus Thermoplasmatota archaeon]